MSNCMPKCFEVVIELLYGHLTPEEVIKLEASLVDLDDLTLRKAILVRTHNVCEKLLVNQLEVS